MASTDFKKHEKTLLIVGGVAVAGYFVYHYVQSQNASAAYATSVTPLSDQGGGGGSPFATDSGSGSSSSNSDILSALTTLGTQLTQSNTQLEQEIQALASQAQNPPTINIQAPPVSSAASSDNNTNPASPNASVPNPNPPSGPTVPVKGKINNAGLLAPGAKSPSYQLVKPVNHPNALWAGPNKPGANWVGVGGGWWVKK